MKILLLSDTHGRNKMLDKVLEMHPDCDLYLHCGDIETPDFLYPQLRVVSGNNDMYYDYPDKMILNVEGHRIYMTHSHLCGYFNRINKLSELAIANGCDIAFYGHTHVASDQVVNGVRCINPGSLRYNRDGRNPSYAIVTIDRDIKVDFRFEPFE